MYQPLPGVRRTGTLAGRTAASERQSWVGWGSKGFWLRPGSDARLQPLLGFVTFNALLNLSVPLSPWSGSKDNDHIYLLGLL